MARSIRIQSSVRRCHSNCTDAQGLGYVVRGNHLSQWEGSEPEYYKAGDTFVDRAEERHIKTENLGPGELEIIISYVIPIGQANITPIVS